MKSIYESINNAFDAKHGLTESKYRRLTRRLTEAEQEVDPEIEEGDPFSLLQGLLADAGQQAYSEKGNPVSPSRPYFIDDVITAERNGLYYIEITKDTEDELQPAILIATKYEIPYTIIDKEDGKKTIRLDPYLGDGEKMYEDRAKQYVIDDMKFRKAPRKDAIADEIEASEVKAADAELDEGLITEESNMQKLYRKYPELRMDAEEE